MCASVGGSSDMSSGHNAALCASVSRSSDMSSGHNAALYALWKLALINEDALLTRDTARAGSLCFAGKAQVRRWPIQYSLADGVLPARRRYDGDRYSTACLMVFCRQGADTMVTDTAQPGWWCFAGKAQMRRWPIQHSLADGVLPALYYRFWCFSNTIDAGDESKEFYKHIFHVYTVMTFSIF